MYDISNPNRCYVSHNTHCSICRSRECSVHRSRDSIRAIESFLMIMKCCFIPRVHKEEMYESLPR